MMGTLTFSSQLNETAATDAKMFHRSSSVNGLHNYIGTHRHMPACGPKLCMFLVNIGELYRLYIYV